jgi:O-antigen ligase
MPIVSFKFLIDRCWGVATFYFLGIYLFRDRKNIRRFIWLYTASFTIVIFYTMFRQVQGHFTEKVSHFAMNPFYNDHTAYGAMLAMFMPVLLVFSFNKATRPAFKITAAILFFIFLAALGMSYSRASWVSVVVALFIFLLLKFRVKLTYIFAAICLAIALFFVFETQIIMKLQKNENQVSQKLGTEIESISNISTDASNLERLNRWSCAYRMFLDKPLIGFGPGTYSFQYAPYQLSYERTIISTNLGNGGNAHSEYLGPLAEQGIMGMLSFVGLAVMLFILSFRLNERLKDNELKLLSTGIFLGLVTYFVHGAMNNFLDTDKAAVPFWGFIGILVAIDLQSRVQVSPQTGDTSEARH